MTPALYADCQDAVHVITADGRVLRAARAVLFLLASLGWRRLAGVLSWGPLLWLMELGYRLVAKNRRLAANAFSRAEDPEQLAYEQALIDSQQKGGP